MANRKYHAWQRYSVRNEDGWLEAVFLPFGFAVGIGSLGATPPKWWYWVRRFEGNGTRWQLRLAWFYFGYGWHHVLRG